MKVIVTTLFIQTLFINCSFAQLTVSGAPAEVLVNEVLAGSSITISNVTYSGWQDAIGFFSGTVENMPFESGILLTTGSIYNSIGPNNTTSAGGINASSATSSQLSAIATGPCYDVAKLEFDFEPASDDSIKFEFIFGSDEYPEYVGNAFGDVFGVFISGYGFNSPQNMAKVPGQLPITINSVNNGNPSADTPFPPTNPDFYVDNGTGTNPPYNSSDQYLQYDGLTIPIQAATHVAANHTYHLEISIADVGDSIFDSGVFIKAHSLTANTKDISLSEAFSISPNPVVDALTINYNRLAPGKVEIYDLTGRYFGEYNLAQQQTKISLSSLPQGSYTLKFITSEGQCSKLISKL